MGALVTCGQPCARPIYPEAIGLSINGAGEAHRCIVDGLTLQDENPRQVSEEIQRMELLAGRQRAVALEAEPVVAEVEDFRAGVIGNAFECGLDQVAPPSLLRQVIARRTRGLRLDCSSAITLDSPWPKEPAEKKKELLPENG